VVQHFVGFACDAGARCGTIEALDALIQAVTAKDGKWSIVYISEVDVRLEANDFAKPCYTMPGWVCHRWWPGGGSRAMAVILRNRVLCDVKAMNGVGRCICLYVDSSMPESVRCSVNVVCCHMPRTHAPSMEQNSAILEWLNSVKRERNDQCLMFGDANVDHLRAPVYRHLAPQTHPAWRQQARARYYSLMAMLDTVQALPIIPAKVHSAPFDLEVRGYPLVSRLPVGEQATGG
jgi:exonuclease III